MVTKTTFLAAFVSVVLFGSLPSLMVTAVHAESDSKRAKDGFNDGSNAARTDTTFNPVCDPLGLHTSDGQHTTIYCNAWAQGYTSTWNSIHGQDQTQTQDQFQQQRQTQNQHGNCIALSCNIIQGGSQGQEQQNSQGNTGP